MATTAQGRGVPAHLWIVGIVALLWNAFGCYDYWMTMTANQTYLGKFPADAIAYIDGLPKWLVAMWAVGVWGGLLGALLLLARSRLAVGAFLLSAIGAIVGMGYEKFMTAQPASMTSGAMAIMPWVVTVLTLAFLWYALNADRKGLLR